MNPRSMRNDHGPMESPITPRIEINLLGTWTLSRDGVEINVAANRQRLIALLALKGPQNRAFVAGALWPDRSQSQAQSNLRSTLRRLQMSGINAVESVGDILRLSPDVHVDTWQLVRCAETVVHGPLAQAPPPETVLCLQRGGELLVGWYDDWVGPHRERLRQLRLHALEIAATMLSRDGRYAEALEAALRSVDLEPLRESAHRAVTLVHLAEGNHFEAIRQFQRYRNLLFRELGIEPSDRMLRMVQPYMGNVTAPRTRVTRTSGKRHAGPADAPQRRAG
jgi:DNA-binding SARP family transcriptional activator